ncbi:MAG: hypothetical protein U0X20_23605 [Caldilineaceae bacterium]
MAQPYDFMVTGSAEGQWEPYRPPANVPQSPLAQTTKVQAGAWSPQKGVNDALQRRLGWQNTQLAPFDWPTAAGMVLKQFNSQATLPDWVSQQYNQAKSNGGQWYMTQDMANRMLAPYQSGANPDTLNRSRAWLTTGGAQWPSWLVGPNATPNGPTPATPTPTQPTVQPYPSYNAAVMPTGTTPTTQQPGATVPTWGAGQWPNVPQAPNVPQGPTAGNYLGSIFGTPAFLNNAGWAQNPQLTAEARNWATYGVPVAQTMQNAYQYSNDFNEAARRFNTQQGWQMYGDQFNMDLARQQQMMAEWQANEAARQWQQQFGYQAQRDVQEQKLALQQVWGRAQAPNVRWMNRTW